MLKLNGNQTETDLKQLTFYFFTFCFMFKNFFKEPFLKPTSRRRSLLICLPKKGSRLFVCQLLVNFECKCTNCTFSNIFSKVKLFIDQYLSYLLFLLKFQNIVQLKTPNIHLCFLNLLDLILLDAFISKIGGLVTRGFFFLLLPDFVQHQHSSLYIPPDCYS
jgi:hypothetical protein